MGGSSRVTWYLIERVGEILKKGIGGIVVPFCEAGGIERIIGRYRVTHSIAESQVVDYSTISVYNSVFSLYATAQEKVLTYQISW